jgi:hypothetical protein
MGLDIFETVTNITLFKIRIIMWSQIIFHTLLWLEMRTQVLEVQDQMRA